MPEIFQTQFEGKTVKRKFCNIPVEKIIEFQNLLGFLPEEFLTFDGGSTYKICVQYAATKDAIEKSYEGTVYYLPEEPANLIIGVNENGVGGTVSKYPRFFEIGEGYLEPYGFILDVSLTRYSEDFSSYVYMINERYDYSLDKRVYDARFIRKICEGYFWSYSLDTSDLNFNIKLHQVQQQNRVTYKPVNLKLVGNLIDLPEDLLEFHTGTNTINLYECWNVLFKRELIHGKENYVAIGEKIISEDLLKIFFTVYKNYINPGFKNSFPYYSCEQNGVFSKIGTHNTYFVLHKINNKYLLAHYSNLTQEEYLEDLNEATFNFNNAESSLNQEIFNLSLPSYDPGLANIDYDNIKFIFWTKILNNLFFASNDQSVKNSIHSSYLIKQKFQSFIENDQYIKGVIPDGNSFLNTYFNCLKTNFGTYDLKNAYKDLALISFLIFKRYKDYGFAKYINSPNIPLEKYDFGYKVLKENLQIEGQNFLERPRYEDFILINNQIDESENGVYYCRELTDSGDFFLIRNYSTCWDNLLTDSNVSKVDYVVDRNISLNEINNPFNSVGHLVLETNSLDSGIIERKLSKLGISQTVENFQSLTYARYNGWSHEDSYINVLLINQQNVSENGYYKFYLFDKTVSVQDLKSNLIGINSFTFEKGDLNDFLTDNLNEKYKVHANALSGIILNHNNSQYYIVRGEDIEKISNTSYPWRNEGYIVFKLLNYVNLQFITNQSEIEELKQKFFINSFFRPRIKKIEHAYFSDDNVLPYTFIKDLNSNKIFTLNFELNSVNDFYTKSIKFKETNTFLLEEEEKNSIFNASLSLFHRDYNGFYTYNLFDDWNKPTINLSSIENSNYCNLLRSFGYSDEIINGSRLEHLNEAINLFKQKLFYISLETSEYAQTVSQGVVNDINKINGFNFIEKFKNLGELKDYEYNLQNNSPDEEEISCKDLIILKNLLKNSKLIIDQNVLNELSLSYLGLNFNSNNETEIAPNKLYDLFNYTNRSYSPERDTKYNVYKGVKVNLTLDKCWFHTIPKDIHKAHSEILFKFFDKASVARFFDHNRKKTQNLNDKIEIIATPKVDFKEVSWSILISDQSEILSSFYESDTSKWERVRFFNLNNVEISAVKLPLLQAGLNNEAWYIPGNDSMSLFCIEPKAGITLEYDPLERILVHKESTTNSVQNSGIILTRLFSNLDYSPELYVMCSATRNNIFEVSYTKISLEES